MLDEFSDNEIIEEDKPDNVNDKDKQRLLARRRIEEKLEEKRLREEIFDDIYFS